MTGTVDVSAGGGGCVPDRMIRESCCANRNLTRVSGDAERLYWRLHAVADNVGRFQAEPGLVVAACFPRVIGDSELAERFTVARIHAWLEELAGEHLVVLYEVGGERYGYFENWASEQRLRETKPKYPDPIADPGLSTPVDRGDSPPSAADRRDSPLARIFSPPIPSSPVEGLDLPARVASATPLRRRHVPEQDRPFMDLWERALGFVDLLALQADALDPLRNAGETNAEILARLERYLDPDVNVDNPQFKTPRRFRETYAIWVPGRLPPKKGTTHAAVRTEPDWTAEAERDRERRRRRDARTG